MKRIVWSSLDDTSRAACLARPGGGDQSEVEAAVRRVFEQVRADGDTALRALTRRFDGVEIGAFEVTSAEFEAARTTVPAALRVAPTRRVSSCSASSRKPSGVIARPPTSPKKKSKNASNRSRKMRRSPSLCT